jgi:predicted alpha/beta hydrolase family esterase
MDTLIVHGSYGNPNENWFPWLASALREKKRQPLVPHMPEAEYQNLQSWSKVLDSYEGCLAEELDVYSHSLGPAFVVDFVVSRRRPIKKAVFVAPFYGLINIEEFDRVNNTFFVQKSYLQEFRKLCNQVICVFSDNDPYVPLRLSEEFAELTGASVIPVPGGKHLNSSAGYKEFPLLLTL